MDKIEKLLVLHKNVFTTQDLSVIWGISEKTKLWEVIKYYLRKKKLYKIYRGIYSLDKKYLEFELAQKLKPFSYISLHTALSIHGINFQYYSSIHSVSMISKKYMVAGIEYSYHQIKDFIFYNKLGLIDKKTYILACKERAICDSLYIWPRMNMDHLEAVDEEKLYQIALIYKNKRLLNDIQRLIKKFH